MRAEHEAYAPPRHRALWVEPGRFTERALGLFHEALSYRGFLGLGTKETLEFTAYSERFEVVRRPERIYRKVARAT